MKVNLSHKIVSLILALSVLFSFSAYFTASAAEKSGVITVTDEYGLRVRTGPGTNYSHLVDGGEKINLYYGNTVTVLDTVASSNNDADNPYWCKIRFTKNGKTLEGYVTAIYVRITDGTPMPDGVPKEYESYIKALSALHPNWKFVFYDTKINWSELFSESAQGYHGRSLIPGSSPVSYRSLHSKDYDWRNDKWNSYDAGPWYQANNQTIAYYLDPRNFLNDSYIFMFEQLSYNKATHNASGVDAILKGSFMSGSKIMKSETEEVTYSQTFMDAAGFSGVSPYHLASRVIQEVGVNGSPSVSGTYKGYEGYYNFYNIGASQGEKPIENGLKYAKGEGVSEANKQKYILPWNSQYKSILGGAKWISVGYIDRGQDTLYYQKFNTATGVYSHQYMGNIMAPMHEAAKIKQSYSSLGILDEGFTFAIPYYRNMPAKPCELPAKSDLNPNNWLKSLSVDSYSFGFDSEKTEYSLELPASVSKVRLSASPVNANAKISGTGEVSLNYGTNTVRVEVTAQNGSKRTYTVVIKRNSDNRVPMTGISLSTSVLTLFPDDVRNLTVSYLPSTTTDDKTVSWSSSNPAVAVVNNGKITGLKPGEAVITAKVGSFEKSCRVTVSDKFMLGDVDADGAVTIADSLMIFKYKSNEITFSQLAMKAADTDKNGKIELADAIKVYKYKSGEIGSL